MGDHAPADATATALVQAAGTPSSGGARHRVAVTPLTARIAVAAAVVRVSAGLAQVQHRTLASGGA